MTTDERPVTMVRRTDARGNAMTMTIGDACLDIWNGWTCSVEDALFLPSPSQIASGLRRDGLHVSFDGTHYEVIR